MARAKIIIADEDEQYIEPLQGKFITEFYEQIDLEIITDRNYFVTFFSKPQNAEILIVSDKLFESSIQRHSIHHIFVMSEQLEELETGDLNVDYLFKYTSIKDIFNEIISKSTEELNIGKSEKKETQVVLVTSAAGGVGKTTLSMGMAASLTQKYKRVLYINAERLQTFQYMLQNPSAILENDLYSKLMTSTKDVYMDIRHVIRKELFYYLPPFKAALMSIGVEYSIYEKIIMGAKKSQEYDFIIVDTDTVFDEEKAKLFDIADKVVIVTEQNFASVFATNLLVHNINGSGEYIFVCNNFNEMQNNALLTSQLPLNYSVSDYIDHIERYEAMSLEDLSREVSIQRTAFLLI